MKKFRDMLAKIRADHDQDVEEGRAWYRETPEADKIRVWLAIQAMPDDGELGIIARLAQLGMSQLALDDADAKEPR